MLFRKGGVATTLLMRKAFQALTEASGLAISPEKLAIYFDNAGLEVQEKILQMT